MAQGKVQVKQVLLAELSEKPVAQVAQMLFCEQVAQFCTLQVIHCPARSMNPTLQDPQTLLVEQETQFKGVQVMQAFPLVLGTSPVEQVWQKLRLEQVVQLGTVQKSAQVPVAVGM